MTTVPASPGLSPPPSSAVDRWRRIALGWRIVMIVVALVVAGELASSTVSGLNRSGSGASGPSSSFDASATGTEALTQLLTERGVDVIRLTTSLGATALPAHSTVFVLDPTSWNASDTTSLRRALDEGDRVVVGGPSPAPGVLRALLGVGSPPAWTSVPAGTSHPVTDAPEVDGVGTVSAAGTGSYRAPPTGAGEPVPVLEGPGGILALVRPGRGTLVLLATASPLQNGSLARSDNAAFAVDLVAPGSRLFIDEYDHGFGRPGAGLAGLPAPWRWGLGLLLLAIVVWVLSAARRFGPPDEPDRITVPPRVHYVDAMATLLSTRPADQVVRAAAPVSAEARRRLCRRLGLAGDCSDEVLAAHLAHAWDATAVPAEVVTAVLRPPTTADDVVAVGMALSQLDREGRNR
jgi:hypothetical protein